MTRISKLPHERRKEILDTALEMFMKKGYQATSVSDIVKELNVSQGLFYYYFKSKEEVFEAALKQYVDEMAAQLIFIITDSTKTFFERIQEVLAGLAKVPAAGAQPLLDEMQQGDSLDIHLRLSIHVTQLLIEPIELALAELEGKGSVKIKDKAALAAFLAFGIYGLLHGDPGGDNHDHSLDLLTVSELIAGVLGLTVDELMIL